MNLVRALVADSFQADGRRGSVERRNRDMARGLEEIEVGDVQEVSELGGAAMAKYTAALSAVLHGKVSVDVRAERATRYERDGVRGR